MSAVFGEQGVAGGDEQGGVGHQGAVGGVEEAAQADLLILYYYRIRGDLHLDLDLA